MKRILRLLYQLICAVFALCICAGLPAAEAARVVKSHSINDPGPLGWSPAMACVQWLGLAVLAAGMLLCAITAFRSGDRQRLTFHRALRQRPVR
jgi:hypothetical protein